MVSLWFPLLCLSLSFNSRLCFQPNEPLPREVTLVVILPWGNEPNELYEPLSPFNQSTCLCLSNLTNQPINYLTCLLPFTYHSSQLSAFSSQLSVNSVPFRLLSLLLFFNYRFPTLDYRYLPLPLIPSLNREDHKTSLSLDEGRGRVRVRRQLSVVSPPFPFNQSTCLCLSNLTNQPINYLTRLFSTPDWVSISFPLIHNPVFLTHHPLPVTGYPLPVTVSRHWTLDCITISASSAVKCLCT